MNRNKIAIDSRSEGMVKGARTVAENRGKNNFAKTLAALVLLFSSFSLTACNPAVSHSATNIVNGTFQDNYSELEVRL